MHAYTVKHELIKRDGKVRFRKFKEDGYDHYKIRLWIEGDLSKIDLVQYELHPSFHDPLRETNDLSSRFSIMFWTYGEFDVLVRVFLKNGSQVEIPYYLEYSNELPVKNDAYFDETAQ